MLGCMVLRGHYGRFLGENDVDLGRQYIRVEKVYIDTLQHLEILRRTWPTNRQKSAS